jgi:antitoxin HigA-1
LSAATSPTASKRREYPVGRPLQRAPVHPGALMREILEEHTKMTIAETARRMKVSRPALYAVLNGTAAVTAEMALRFARLTGGAPELYLNMQTGHDLEAAQQRLQNELGDIEPGPQHHPSAAISTGKSKTSIRDTRLSRR